MTETQDIGSSIPNINLEGSKSNDVYEINAGVLIAIIAFIVILVAGVIFFKFKSSGNEVAVVPSPTPMVLITESPTPTVSAASPTPTVTGSAKETVTPSLSPKQQIKFQVLNGTGTTGDAAYLKTKLTAAGFATIDTGNAGETSKSAETKVVYYSTFPQSTKIDLNTLLNDLYATVSASSLSETGKYDVVVTTGKKK